MSSSDKDKWFQIEELRRYSLNRMKNYKRYKEAYPDKTDAEIIESLALELSDKVETIHKLLTEKQKSLSLVQIDSEILQMCIDMYKSGEKLTAIKWLIEEVKQDKYTFGIKWVNDFLSKQ